MKAIKTLKEYAVIGLAMLALLVLGVIGLLIVGVFVFGIPLIFAGLVYFIDDVTIRSYVILLTIFIACDAMILINYKVARSNNRYLTVSTVVIGVVGSIISLSIILN